MIWLGEILYMDFDPIDIKFNDLKKMKIRTKKQAIQRMYQYMISIFSPFGKSFIPASENEIGVRDLVFEDVCSLDVSQKFIHIEIKKRIIENSTKQCDMMLLGYGVSGGLHLAFAAILIDVNILQSYIIKNTKLENYSIINERRNICEIIYENICLDQQFALCN